MQQIFFTKLPSNEKQLMHAWSPQIQDWFVFHVKKLSPYPGTERTRGFTIDYNVRVFYLFLHQFHRGVWFTCHSSLRLLLRYLSLL